MNRALGFGVAALVFAVDQLAKYFVAVSLDLRARGSVEVLPVFNLTWVENSGVSLGLLTAGGPLGRWALVALTGVIAAGVLVWLWREANRIDAAALGLILGGAIGNILDRVRLGYVVDFADLHFGAFRPFLVFNVADAAITIGVVILLLRAFLARGEAKAEKHA